MENYMIKYKKKREYPLIMIIDMYKKIQGNYYYIYNIFIIIIIKYIYKYRVKGQQLDILLKKFSNINEDEIANRILEKKKNPTVI